MLVKTGLELHSEVYQSVIGINRSNINVNSLTCCVGVSKAWFVPEHLQAPLLISGDSTA